PIGKYIEKLITTSRSEEELYNLNKDPTELDNLAYDKSYKDIKIELKQKLFNWMKKTDDPIIKGKIKELRGEPVTHY
ncbi:MAG: hypothetical protein ACFFC1_08795, partial [Promethearchaeota archaeon]